MQADAFGAARLTRSKPSLCKIDRDGSSIHGGGSRWVGVHFSIQAECRFAARLNAGAGLMTDSKEQPENLDAAVAGELERLKRLPMALLHALGSGITRVKYVGDHSYELKAWSRPVAGSSDSFVVLVGVLEPGLSSPSHLGGFLAEPSQPYRDLSQETLRSHGAA